jgi:Fe2+ transport system protein B
MRTIGYTDSEISSFSEIFNSNQNSLTQKIRALKRTIRSVKELKNTLNRLLNKEGEQRAVQRGILSTEQQALHVQMQQVQMMAMRDLREKKEEIENRKAIKEELDKTAEEIAKKSISQMKPKSLSYQEGFKLTLLQRWAASASLFTFIMGCIGVMFGLFHHQGIAAIRAGIFGLMLSYLLPAIIHMYRSWLGV